MIRWGQTKSVEAPWSNFVIAGSGYLIFDAKGHVGPRLIQDIEFFKRWGIRPILFGVGINQPSALTLNGGIVDIAPAIEANLRELLSRAKAISVRDSFTQATLSRYTDTRVELTGDPALHLGHLYNIRHTVPPNSQRRRPLIGLNLNFHGPSSTKLLQRNLPIVAKAIKSIRDEHHCDFRYFVHFDAELVVPKLLALDGIEMEVIQGNPETLIRGYAELDLHIGGMLHSCILAHSVDTPAIALAYDIKHRGFLELFGLEKNCIPAADLTAPALIERVGDVLADPSPYQKAISTARERLERITHDFTRTSLSTP
jgi:polysaccharide pyruvyl transferase WcaK-like protein